MGKLINRTSFAFLFAIISLTSCNANVDANSSSINRNEGTNLYSSDNKSSESMHEHSFSDLYQFDDTFHWRPSTCGHDVVSEKEVHDFVIEVTEPTFETDGYTKHTCSICGYFYIDGETSRLEHFYSNDWSFDHASHWHACIDKGYENLKKDESSHIFTTSVLHPTYAHGGFTTYTCSVCGYSFLTDEKEALPITITWKNYDGTILEVDSKVPYGSMPSYDGEAPIREADEKYSYSFSGWDPNLSEAVESVTYTACFEKEINTYQVTWKNWNGDVLGITTHEYGDIPSYGEIPTRENDAQHYYVFDRWEPAISEVVSDATYIASFIQHQCTSYEISYDANGGTNAPTTQIKSRGNSIELSSTIPFREGYEFRGWNNFYENHVYQPGDAFSLDSNVTLYAMWSPYCEECDHTGKMHVEGHCSFCYGRGSVCAVCGNASVTVINGLGTVCSACGATRRKTCSWCGGDGSWTSIVDCDNCNGQGFVSEEAPTAAVVEPRRVVLEAKDGYEYSMDGVNFKSDSTFENLIPNTQYSFYQRIAKNGEVPFGCCSDVLNLTTPKDTTYFITYELNGGVNDPSNPSSYSTTGRTITLLNPTKPHYDFAGWTYDGRIVTSISPSWEADVTLAATWKVTDYSITYDLDGGTATNPSTHGIESAEITLNNPSKRGYTFLGWTGSNGDEPSLEVTIPAGNTDDLSYKANWELNVYSITYDLDGGVNDPSNPSTHSVIDPISLKDPTKEHYDFVGWTYFYNGKENAYSEGNPPVLPLDDLIFTAIWKPHDYSIYYVLQGGTNSESNPLTHNIESGSITLADPTRNGYSFTGWTGSNGAIPSKDVTIEEGSTDNLCFVANWSLNTYKITYELYGGSNSIKNPSTYTIEDSITLKEATKDNNTFYGWYKEPEFINKVETLTGQFGDLTLYAKFVPYSYNSTFDPQGGTITHRVTFVVAGAYTQFVDVKGGDAINLNGYAPDGLFDGWYFDSHYYNKVKEDITITSDLTFYGRLIEHASDYRIPYLPGYYELYLEGLLEGPVDNPNFFIGTDYLYIPYWQTGNLVMEGRPRRGEITITSLVDGSVVRILPRDIGNDNELLVALRPGILYSVNNDTDAVIALYRKDSGTYGPTITNENDASITQDFGTESCVPSRIEREGYDFLGWFDDKGEELPETWDYESDQNFHAEWALHQYEITYNLDGGTNHDSNPSTFTCEEDIELLSPTKEGYTFGGWFSDRNFSHQVTHIDGSNCSDVVLYAKWIPNSYSVTLDYGGGENCPVVDFYSEGSLVRREVLYKSKTLGYFIPKSPDVSLAFAGWYTDSKFENPFPFDGEVNEDLKLYAKWVSTSQQYADLGSDMAVSIDGQNERYIELVCPEDQTIQISSTSNLDLFGAIYDENMNLIASNDDMSDFDLDFGFTVNLKAGHKYYVLCRANQVNVSGEATIHIGGNQEPYGFIVGDSTEVIEDLKVTYGSSVSLPTPHKEGYEFLGWFDENGNEIDAENWGYAENITIYAHWSLLE